MQEPLFVHGKNVVNIVSSNGLGNRLCIRNIAMFTIHSQGFYYLRNETLQNLRTNPFNVFERNHGLSLINLILLAWQYSHNIYAKYTCLYGGSISAIRAFATPFFVSSATPFLCHLPPPFFVHLPPGHLPPPKIYL